MRPQTRNLLPRRYPQRFGWSISACALRVAVASVSDRPLAALPGSGGSAQRGLSARSPLRGRATQWSRAAPALCAGELAPFQYLSRALRRANPFAREAVERYIAEE